MKRWPLYLIAIILLAAVPQILIDSPVYARTVSIAGICLFVWLAEIAPPFIPTLILWAAVPILLLPLDARYSLGQVLSWSADPVLALFFGGFVLGVATERQGLDRQLARFAFRASGGSFNFFLLVMIFITAFLSMWLSNIAAAALVFACVRPSLARLSDDNALRRIVIVGIALGADLGGIATPIGTGPNAIAIASLEGTYRITFVNWMAFAFPLTIGMLLFAFALLWVRSRKHQRTWDASDILPLETVEVERPNRRTEFVLIFTATALLWLTEPLHRIPAAVVAIVAAATVFVRGILSKKDLSRVDWSTILLIAGGITLGRLLEATGIVSAIASAVPFSSFDPRVTLFVLCLASAILSALMSNTATAVMLIPLAAAIMPDPSTAILIAISASFGLPFVISTPPNAMAFGEGGVRSSDFFWPGVIIMITGCAAVSLTGRAVLNLAGIP
jgi:sodium-dependent dicarboxylate transporter 2/3/5